MEINFREYYNKNGRDKTIQLLHNNYGRSLVEARNLVASFLREDKLEQIRINLNFVLDDLFNFLKKEIHNG